MIESLILVLGAVFAGLSGFFVLSSARSAIHEIEAFILMLIAAVLFSGGLIVREINWARKKIIQEIRSRPSSPSQRGGSTSEIAERLHEII